MFELHTIGPLETYCRCVISISDDILVILWASDMYPTTLYLIQIFFFVLFKDKTHLWTNIVRTFQVAVRLISKVMVIRT